MSDYKTHLVIGYISVAVVVAILYQMNLVELDTTTLLWIVIVTYIFSLLPDIDHPISTITWNFLGIGILGIAMSIINIYRPFMDNGTTIMIASAGLLVLTFVCAQFAGHRDIIHTVVAGLVFAAGFYLIIHSVIICLLGIVAYYSHLCADDMWDSFVP